MTVKEANADIGLTPDAMTSPTRLREAEGTINVDQLPGVKPGEYQLEVESMEELEIVMQAIQEEDQETVKQYIERID